MPTRSLKLFVLFLVALALLACAPSEPQLAPSLAPQSSGSGTDGWKDF